MIVNFPPDLQAFVDKAVASGQYQDLEDLIVQGVRLLRERTEDQEKKLADLRAAIQVGIDEADRGEGRPFTDEVVDGIIARGKERLRQKRQG